VNLKVKKNRILYDYEIDTKKFDNWFKNLKDFNRILLKATILGIQDYLNGLNKPWN
jgi:hypothetical protein